MENHVCSLEWAKKLKEAGWEKKCQIKHGKNHLGEWSVNFVAYNAMYTEIIPAPLATELLEELPFIIEAEKVAYELIISKLMRAYYVDYYSELTEDSIRLEKGWHSKSLPDALAECYCFLKKNNLIK